MIRLSALAFESNPIHHSAGMLQYKTQMALVNLEYVARIRNTHVVASAKTHRNCFTICTRSGNQSIDEIVMWKTI